MTSVVFFEMLRAVFWARCFTMKLPNPRRYIFSFCCDKLMRISYINASTVAATSFLAMPVSSAILLIISAFVISVVIFLLNTLFNNRFFQFRTAKILFFNGIWKFSCVFFLKICIFAILFVSLQ